MSEPFSIDKGRVITPVAAKEDEAFDRAVRPRRLVEYIGQPRVKAQLEIFIAAARQRSDCSYDLRYP
jgi:Holliday junction DNA helicase RuvB